ncbi:hypothetical protein B7P43_G16059 [Cryptotermes secundus]|uniref:Uncharacterized protein n=1 Tax=Cryptotermes secundus TaxID=105785 RepID=A0A2J7QIM5_9NEOP|nr:hypothetical protein B7P43_G16059 [Cryptotermes secundus]
MAHPNVFTAKHRQLVRCTVNVASRYVSTGHPLVVSSSAGNTEELPSFSSDLLAELHAFERWPLYTVHEKAARNLERGYAARKYTSYIIIAQVCRLGVSALLKRISTQVQFLQEIEAGNPKGVFLVILLNDGRVDKELLREVLASLWQWKILDVIVMIAVKRQSFVTDNDTQVNLFSWFPFQSPNRCTQVTDVVLMDQCNYGAFLKNADLFPKKITRNLNRCPLTASTISWGDLVIVSTETSSDGAETKVTYKDGLEVTLYNTIAETFNMTAAFIVPIPSYGNIWGDYFPVNNTYTGVIGDAKFGRSNVSFCGLPKNFFFELHIDSTHSYVESGFNWYVQCARPRPRWQVFVRTFTFSVWAVLILAFFAFAIMMWFLAKFPDERQEDAKYRSFFGTFEALFAVFLNVGVSRMPLTLSVRTFFCLWVWSCFALTIVFETYFTSLLVDPGLEKQVSDVEELLASDLVLTFDNGYVPLFEDMEERETLIMSRWVSCAGFEACSRRTATIGDAATVLDFQTFDYYKHKFVDNNGESLLCRLPGKISGYFITMFMQKGNPLFQPVNDVILHMMEAGLVDFWWSVIVERLKLRRYQESEEAPITYFVFSMSHLYVAFTFLALGYGLSVSIFILELLSRVARVPK